MNSTERFIEIKKDIPPPIFQDIRFSHTYVMVRFIQLNSKNTRVVLSHYGWGVGASWEKAFEYFQNAWNLVLTWNEEKYTPGWKPRWD